MKLSVEYTLYILCEGWCWDTETELVGDVCVCFGWQMNWKPQFLNSPLNLCLNITTLCTGSQSYLLVLQWNSPEQSQRFQYVWNIRLCLKAKSVYTCGAKSLLLISLQELAAHTLSLSSKAFTDGVAVTCKHGKEAEAVVWRIKNICTGECAQSSNPACKKWTCGQTVCLSGEQK